MFFLCTGDEKLKSVAGKAYIDPNERDCFIWTQQDETAFPVTQKSLSGLNWTILFFFFNVKRKPIQNERECFFYVQGMKNLNVGREKLI